MSTKIFVGSMVKWRMTPISSIVIGTAFQIKQTQTKNECLLALIVDEGGISISAWLWVDMVL